ncbi:polysaccharide biosynthesis tyrosine autokinase [Rhodopirellula sp. P2]|uniref:polysaccharide biosynthesis tyrosine autokinase n=1 Tax=Rhodopirellula sp. P2 TaxID=2127060 RepID=UPI002368555F|nr:polysaccharide biosynthesis tyrosine autokinase [Rhodopirellula sp. P2]WDQ17500.1 polysaccharide biosynthesis tyrosine autokinase [Rhodopirellula sp. P2]
MAESAKPTNRLPARGPSSASSDGEETLDVLQILSRQRWLIAFLAIAGLAAGVAYALNAQVWYESNAKVLINQKSAGLGGNSTGTDMVDEDILANHMELIQSRMIVGEALEQNELLDLPSIETHLDEKTDAIDYVIDQLSIVKGGDGSAKTARSLNITFTHTDPDDAKLILTAVMKRYEQFIIDQVEQVMGRANEMVNKAKTEVETDLIAAEQEHLKARQEAPLFFQGEGSSNIYQDRYRRLQDELLDLDIQESTVKTRLTRVDETLKEMDESTDPIDQLDKLALIDSDSLERLGVFAGLQMNSANTAEFKAAMPAKMEEARTQITHLLKLNSEKQRLTSVFGPGHPKVQELESEITLVKEFLQDQKDLTSPAEMFGDSALTPEGLLKAYVGFLQHDLAALSERRKELTYLAADAETKAKELIEYELTDMILQKKIGRQEALFEGVVQQLRALDTASGLTGYLYEFLAVPRTGEKSWPKLPLCGLGGLMLGLFSGLFLAVANDVRDGRFRSAAELDDAIGLPSLGRVGKLNSINQGIKGLIATELSPDAEAFRLGRTVLLPDIRSGSVHTIGFTSPMQGDGKSTVVSNFAVSFSQVGLKVLVIDADLRRPSAHRYFSLGKEDGLCDVLEDRLEISEAIKATEADNVFVMTSGSSSHTPAELLQSQRLDEVLAVVKEDYDLVLVDLPPVLAVSDPVVVMPRLDGGILVVKVANVRRDEVVNTLRRIGSSGGEMLGCMLNAFGAGKKFDSDGGYYGYYKSDYTRPTSSATRQAAPKAATITSNGQPKSK